MMTAWLRRRINWKVFGQTWRMAHWDFWESKQSEAWDEPKSHFVITEWQNHNFGTFLLVWNELIFFVSVGALSPKYVKCQRQNAHYSLECILPSRRKSTVTWSPFLRAWRSSMASILTQSFPLKRYLSFQDIETFLSLSESFSPSFIPSAVRGRLWRNAQYICQKAFTLFSTCHSPQNRFGIAILTWDLSFSLSPFIRGE